MKVLIVILYCACMLARNILKIVKIGVVRKMREQGEESGIKRE